MTCARRWPGCASDSNKRALTPVATAARPGIWSTRFEKRIRCWRLSTRCLESRAIEAGQAASEFTVVDASALARDVAEFYEVLAEEKRQALHATVEPGVTVRGDRDLIFQALANLIENALKYAPPASAVSVSMVRLHARAVITIADHGPGIPPALRERVFRRFFRLDASRSSPGNGLGLSLVQAVVALHNGSIELADNHPGLKAVIKLPLAETATATGAG